MRSKLLATAFAGGIALALHLTGGQPATLAAAALPNDDRTIIHVLNRLGFGARPDDIERVRRIGVQAYIEEQLHPERIPDASMASRLAGFSTLEMSSGEIAERFVQPAMAARREQQQQSVQQGDTAPPPMRSAAQREASRVMSELTAQKVLRAVYSERQLQEVLTDFWFNHFNVDARKGQTRFMLTAYERDAIRPHVLGKFGDLLEASAKSPAMLFYLDNWMSADPNGPHPDRPVQIRRPGRRAPIAPVMPPRPVNPQQNTRRGLNENYARELMELHTLGVDGGYTQKDVTEVARAFTGWTIQNPRQGGDYVFNRRVHDPREKVVLGKVFRGDGEQEGEAVLAFLADHPSTARFVSEKLARRFVSDTPPAALVERLATRFRETDGDLRQVMQVLLTSPEFLSPEAFRAKVKTPLEFVVSAVRATGIDVREAVLVRAVQQLGMPLYMCQPPTGYKDTADAWVNTGALVNRMNFALQLAGGDRARSRSGPAPEDIVKTVLNDDIAETTRATIAKATTPQQRVALILGSPEFQRR
jgi:uncharacterized protein (DUF1800 family)